MNHDPLRSGWDPFQTGWHFVRRDQGAGQQQGPLSWQELWARAQSGVLRPDDLVWHPTYPAWVPAAQVPGLFASTGRQGQPPARGWFARFGWVLPVVTLVVVALVVTLVVALRDGERDATSAGPGGTPGVATSTPLTTPPITAPPAEPDTWLVMLYMAADDEVLEQDIVFDLNEAELIGSTDRVTIVAQIDRFAGGSAPNQEFTSTKRYLVTRDSDLNVIGSTELADLGELDMGDPRTLRDFAVWAIKTYPAARHALILSDHGAGWTGGWTDNDPLAGSALSLQEIDMALAEIVAKTGIQALELVGFDACLMGQLEVANAIAPHARFAVASEDVEPSVGWSYAGFLQALVDDPSLTGRELSQAIVGSYIRQDARVNDEEARRRLTGGDYTPEEVIEVLSRDVTLAAIDLSGIQTLDAALNELAAALATADQRLVARARTHAQSFANIFGESRRSSFIDLGHFLALLAAGSLDEQISELAVRVRGALQQIVVAEAHGPGRPGASGLSLYFPNSGEYEATFEGQSLNYAASVGRLAAATLWDDFLTYHYTGKPFDPAQVDLSVVTPPQASLTDFAEAAKRSAPPSGVSITAPGKGAVSIAPLTLSPVIVTPDQKVTVSTRVTGTNIAYIYYYVSFYVEEDGSFLSADAGFVEPGAVKEVGGVYYPDWGDSETVDVEFAWEPTLFFMSDGDPAHDQFAFFVPTVYGPDVSGDVYTVRGTYTFQDTGTRVVARIEFSGGGEMLGVWGFFPSPLGSGAGSWYEITPTPGDTFTITKEFLEFTDNPEGEFVDYDGDTMVFGDRPFTMVPYRAPAGEYALGVGVEDLDSNLTWEFARVVVQD